MNDNRLARKLLKKRGRYLKENMRDVQLVTVEPEESSYISKGIFRPHRIMGTALGFVPETLDRTITDCASGSQRCNKEVHSPCGVCCTVAVAMN